MLALIFLVVLAVVAIGLFFWALREGSIALGAAGFLALGLAGLCAWFAFFYTQTVGEAKVVRSVTGEVVTTTTEPGAHSKAPWSKLTTFDVFANTANFVGNGEGSHDGNPVTGPQITFQDSEGVSANLDLQVTYNLDPEAIEQILTKYGSQESFVAKVIEVGARAVAREVPNEYTTLDVYTKRGEIGAEIAKRLTERFADDGVIVTEATVQEIRYPSDVVQRFSDAQAARTEVEKAKAEKDKATIEAEKAVEVARGESEAAIEKARGEAEANRLIAESLTPQVLEQRYIDAIAKAGTTFVVPEGSQPLVNTAPPAAQ